MRHTRYAGIPFNARTNRRGDQIVDVLVQDDWWFDRDALQAALPAD